MNHRSLFGLLVVAALCVWLGVSDPTRSSLSFLFQHWVLQRNGEDMVSESRTESDLIRIMGHSEILLHVVAANRLLERGSPDPFLLAIRGDDASSRSVAAHWLQNFNEQNVRLALRVALKDESEHVRMWAVHSLGIVGCPEDVLMLSNMIDDPSRIVRSKVSKAIEGIQLGGTEY